MTKTNNKDIPANVQTIALPALRINRLKLHLKGISPLLTHRFSEKAKKEMRDKQQKKARNAKEAKDPHACFMEAKHLDKNGKDAVPVLAFKNAIVSAARYADDLKMTVLRGALFVHGDTRGENGEQLVTLNFADCIMREDTVRIGMGTTDLRYRPEYHDWSVDLVIEYNSSVLTPSQIVNLVNLAGFSVGICEWRPERDGQHGRFAVDMDAVQA